MPMMPDTTENAPANQWKKAGEAESRLDGKTNLGNVLLIDNHKN